MSTGHRSPVKLGYEEYSLFPNDGNRHEVIDGYHHMNPAPTPEHQSISMRLTHELYTRIQLKRLGTVFAAPIDIQLSENDIVQPDLVVLTVDSRAEVTPTRIVGPPELVIEILSPSTAQNDMTLKRRLYEQAGVKEYWIVDSRQRTVTLLVIKDGRYHEQVVSDQLSPSLIPEVQIKLADIW